MAGDHLRIVKLKSLQLSVVVWVLPEVVENVERGVAVAGASHVLEPAVSRAEGGAPRPTEEVEGGTAGGRVHHVFAGVIGALNEVFVDEVGQLLHHFALHTLRKNGKTSEINIMSDSMLKMRVKYIFHFIDQ